MLLATFIINHSLLIYKSVQRISKMFMIYFGNSVKKVPKMGSKPKKLEKGPKPPKRAKNGQNRPDPRKPTDSWGFGANAKNGPKFLRESIGPKSPKMAKISLFQTLGPEPPGPPKSGQNCQNGQNGRFEPLRKRVHNPINFHKFVHKFTRIIYKIYRNGYKFAAITHSTKNFTTFYKKCPKMAKNAKKGPRGDHDFPKNPDFWPPPFLDPSGPPKTRSGRGAFLRESIGPGVYAWTEWPYT